MPTYIIVMILYTLLAGYVLYLVAANMLKSEDRWEQIMAIFVIVPLLMRFLFIK